MNYILALPIHVKNKFKTLERGHIPLNDSSANITITDACCVNCCNSVYEKQLCNFTLTSYVALQNGYAFTILNITSTTVTVALQNGVFYYIRTIPVGSSIPFCVPKQNGKHIITVTVNSVNI